MLNFKGWEKIAEDNKATTLKHEKGHTMTLAHKKLPKIQQEALKRLKMADGGDVQQQNNDSSGSMFSGIFGAPKAQASDTPPPNRGTSQGPNGELSGTATNFFEKMKHAKGGQIKKYADGTPDSPVQDDAKPTTNVIVNSPPQNASMQSTQPAPIVQPNLPTTPNVIQRNGVESGPGVAQTSQAAIGLNADIAAQKAKADAVYQQQYLDERQRINNIDANNIADLKKHTDDFSDYLKTNPINPNAYLDNKGTAGKISTGLGLLLSGAGSGLAHQSNLAMDFLNKQIDRSIDAQKSNADQQKTIWGAYNSLYGNQTVATNLAKVSMNDMLVHQSDLTAAQLGTATAKANAMALKAQKAAENTKLISDSAAIFPKFINPHGDQNIPQQSNKEPNITNGPMSNDEVARMKNSLIGEPGANANIPEKSGKEDYYESHILKPNANQILHSDVQYGTQKSKEDYAATEQQMKQAMQADKAMEKVGELFPQIKGKANLPGYIANSVNPHALGALGAGAGATLAGIGTLGMGIPVGAGLGAAAGEGVGHALQATGTLGGQKEIQYQALKNELLKILKAAMPNGTEEQIHSIVESQTPTWRDNPDTVKLKLKAIRDFIKTNTPTDLIENYNMTKSK